MCIIVVEKKGGMYYRSDQREHMKEGLGWGEGNRSSQEQKRSTNNNKRGAIVIFGRLKCARGRGWFLMDRLFNPDREFFLIQLPFFYSKPHTYIEPRRCFRLVIIIVIFLERLYSLLFGIPYWETWMWCGHKCVQSTCPVTNFLLKKRRRNSEIRFAQFWKFFYSWSFICQFSLQFSFYY